MGMLLYEAASNGDKEMTEYLISSFSDVININLQDKVSIEYCMMMIMIVCTYWIVIIINRLDGLPYVLQ